MLQFGLTWMSLLLCVLLYCRHCLGVGGGQHQRAHAHRGTKLEDFTKDEEIDPLNQFKNEEFIRNKEHIREHFQDKVDFDFDKVTKEELEFYFFKLQDTNDDKLLDGLELMASIEHALEEQFEDIEEDEELDPSSKSHKSKILSTRVWLAVDRILREDDGDKDGFISYPEFAKSTRAAKDLRGDSFTVYPAKKP